MEVGEHELTALGVRLEDPEVGDHGLRTMTGHLEVLPRPLPPCNIPTVVMKSSFSTKVLGFWRSRTRVRWQNARDLRRPAGAGESHPGLPIVADDGRVEVPEAVDLGGAEKSGPDPAALQPVVEHLRHRHHRPGGAAELRISDGERQHGRLGVERPALIDHRELRCVSLSCEVGGLARQADADEHHVIGLEKTRRGHDHHLFRVVPALRHSRLPSAWRGSA